MLDEVPDLDMLVVPIGGGGIIAGNAIAARAVRETIEIVGVEAALYHSMRNAVTGANDPIGGVTGTAVLAVYNVVILTLAVGPARLRLVLSVDPACHVRPSNAP